ncbi:MAG: hypothetical protein ACLGIR_08800 [Actinomycetes bacterium]
MRRPDHDGTPIDTRDVLWVVFLLAVLAVSFLLVAELLLDGVRGESGPLEVALLGGMVALPAYWFAQGAWLRTVWGAPPGGQREAREQERRRRRDDAGGPGAGTGDDAAG